MPAAAHPITVRELWSLALPTGTTLLAGEAGLGQVVEWVTSLRATFPTLSGLDSGYMVLARLSRARERDGRLTPRFLVQELARAAIAALVVDEVPEADAVALAAQQGLPLLLLPAESDLYEAERDLLRALFDAQGLLARRQAEARERFQDVLQRDGLNAVLDALAQAIAGAAVLTTKTGETFGEADRLPASAACTETRYPTQVAGRELGELTVRVCEARREPLDAVLARAAADVCAVELLERLTRRQIEDELGTDLIEQLLSGGPLAHPAHIRMERQGYMLQGERDHLVVAAPTERPGATGTVADMLRDIAWAARRDGAATLQLPYSGNLLLFISHATPLEGYVVRRWIAEALARGGDRNALGISRTVRHSAELGQAIRQALGAQGLGSRIAGRVGPHYYDDLGLYRVLSDLRDRAELQRFYQETLGDLLAYDQVHDTELVHTLQVLFAENTNISQTARALYVHRNTLNYRLQRIAEISGYDLNDAETRLTLQLALRLHQLIAS